jgi:hypothetical protein
MGLDIHQRIGLGVALVGTAYFLGHTAYKSKPVPFAQSRSELISRTPPDPRTDTPNPELSAKPKEVKAKRTAAHKQSVPPPIINQSAPGGIASVAMPGSTVENKVTNVNQPPPDRTIDEARVTRMIDILSTARGTAIVLTLIQGGSTPRETNALFAQILGVFEKSGWAVTQSYVGIIFAASIPPLDYDPNLGIHLFAKEPSLAERRLVAEALGASGLSFESHDRPSPALQKSNSLVQIVVGRKPAP